MVSSVPRQRVDSEEDNGLREIHVTERKKR